jgi:hypothetical protein
MPNDIKRIVILGASITSSPWYTWKDYVEVETNLKCYDLSARGVGNEYLAHNLMANEDLLDEQTLVLCMLTSFDKFDWYVTGQRYIDLQVEKHKPRSVSASSGFWCTGSWFPLEKDIFKQTFYDEDYFCAKAIQQVLLMQKICQVKNSNLILFFDSPIWTLTEQAINHIKPDNQQTSISALSRDFLAQPLSSMWKQYIDQSLIDVQDSSLLGYCWKKGLLWYNEGVKCHPPSSSQWSFYQDIVKPSINQYVPTQDVDLTKKIQTFDEKWKEY